MAARPDNADPQHVRELGERVADPDRAAASLPKNVREAHYAAQESVVDARRNAELREGQLRVH